MTTTARADNVSLLCDKGRNMLSVRLPAQLEKRLDRLARTTGRAKSWYVREALVQHIEDLEDIYIAEKRIADLRAGRGYTIPLEEVMKEHGTLES